MIQGVDSDQARIGFDEAHFFFGVLGFGQSGYAIDAKGVSVAPVAVLGRTVQMSIAREDPAGRSGATQVGEDRVLGVWGPGVGERIGAGEQEEGVAGGGGLVHGDAGEQPPAVQMVEQGGIRGTHVAHQGFVEGPAVGKFHASIRIDSAVGSGFGDHVEIPLPGEDERVG